MSTRDESALPIEGKTLGPIEYAFILSRRDPTLGDRVGSIVADRE